MIKRKNITIRDVAQKAGVSLGTASQALNNKPGVSAITMSKVLAVAKGLDYIPSITAQQLRDKKSNIISLHIIVSDNDIIHPSTWGFYFHVIRGFTNKVKKCNFKLHLEFNFIQEISQSEMLRNYLKGYNIQGAAFIIVTKGDYGGLLEIKKLSIPIVTIYAKIHDAIPSITIDNYSASYNIITWLKELGHRKIAFIGGPCSDYAAIDRKRGYIDAMRNINFCNAFDGTWDIESGISIFKKMKSMNTSPSAIVCANDHMAMGVLNACHELRIKVPQDISLVGFDNDFMCEVSNTKLTSVMMPLFKMGKKAADLLINASTDGTLQLKHFVFPAKLIHRDSVISV